MHTEYCKDFEDYLEKSNKLLDKYSDWISDIHKPRIRGHADSKWPLDSTLDRFLERENIKAKLKASDYSKIIQSVYPQVLSISTELGIPCPKKPPKIYNPKNWHDFTCEEYFPNLIYMSFLRQYGCPSPLIDWTFNEKVSLKFAINTPKDIGKSIAIIFYFEFGPNNIVNNRHGNSITSVKGIGDTIPITIQNRLKAHYSISYTYLSNEIFYDSNQKYKFNNKGKCNHFYKFVIPSSEVVKIQAFTKDIETEDYFFNAKCTTMSEVVSQAIINFYKK